MVPVNNDKKRVAIPKMFNMTNGVSASSFIAVGLTISSPENSSEPAYYSQDLVRLLSMKQANLRKQHSGYITLICWILFCTYAFGKYGQLTFDHKNIDKAYRVMRKIINKNIKDLEDDLTGHPTQDDPYEDSSEYEKKLKGDEVLYTNRTETHQ